jgi:predicted transposase/invertase (TIGR01784 family)
MTDTNQRFSDLKSDFGFKHVFANPANKDLLLSLLNALLPEKEISDVELSPTEYKYHRDTNRIFFDLSCKGQQGEIFIIEMQRKRQHYFSNRSIYYMSLAIANQLKAGKIHEDYPLKEVYFIGILNFNMMDTDEKTHLHNISLHNTLNGNLFSNKIHYVFTELLNFDKRESELISMLDKWLYLIRYLPYLNTVPEKLNQPIFQKLFQIAEINKLTKEERMLFDRRLKTQRDIEANIRYAADEGREMGRAEGIQLGLKKGKKEGLVEGKKEGLVEGKNQEKLLIARKLLQTGIPLSEVAEITGLSVEQLSRT